MSRGPLLLVTAAALGLALAAIWAADAAVSSSSLSAARRQGERALPRLRASTASAAAASPLLLPKDLKLASPLVFLAESAVRAEAAGPPLTARSPLDAFPPELRGLLATRRMRLTEAGDVQAFIIVDNPSWATTAALAALGARIERIEDDAGAVQAQVPPQRLRAIASLPGVRRLRLPDYPYRHEGSVLSQGDAVLSVDDVRSTFGVDGAGITVGVISDGVAGLAESQASGDLPAVDTTTCNVVAGDPGASGAEGTAMLEIVHDLAPGAALIFGNFGYGTVLDFNAAVDCLAANADLVVDDIGWFGVGPYDGTSIVSTNTAEALNGSGPIRGYHTAVGNMALEHYQEPYQDSGFDQALPPAPDTWDLHRFAATNGTTDAGIGLPCSCADALELLPGGSLDVSLVWDDPFGASANDYDLFLFLNDVPVAVGGDPQLGNDDPVESLSYTNNTAASQVLDLLIGNFNGLAAPRTFDLFILCSPDCQELANGAYHNYNTPGSSVPNQSDAGGSPASVIAVGAVWHADPDTAQPYSSRGPSEDGRLKPDLAGPDGVSVTGAGGFSSPFFGSSAASPHVAAVAALLLECNPSLSRVALRDLLLGSTVDLGVAGPDSESGRGRLDALAAATAAGCGSPPPPTSTPTITPTPTATPTLTATATPTPTPLPPGDASCDGDVNSIDATLILQYDAGLTDALACEDAADVNNDGGVNALDAALILQFDAGLIDSLEPGSAAAHTEPRDTSGSRRSARVAWRLARQLMGQASGAGERLFA